MADRASPSEKPAHSFRLVEQVEQAGWMPHLGNGCPLPECQRPAVRFRSGSEYNAGRTEARYWRDYPDRDLWSWDASSAEMNDIIAYRPEETSTEFRGNI